MPIPGFKVLDDIIAGLPTNSAQRLEIAKLQEQISALQKENDELRRENSSLKPTKLEPEFRRVGDAYFEIGPDGNAVGHPYCLHCWESSRKRSSLVRVMASIMRCQTCRGTCQRGLGWPPSM